MKQKPVLLMQGEAFSVLIPAGAKIFLVVP